MSSNDWYPPFSDDQPGPRGVGQPPTAEEREAERRAAAKRVSRKRAARKLLHEHGFDDVKIR